MRDIIETPMSGPSETCRLTTVPSSVFEIAHRASLAYAKNWDDWCAGVGPGPHAETAFRSAVHIPTTVPDTVWEVADYAAIALRKSLESFDGHSKGAKERLIDHCHRTALRFF